MAEWKLLGKRMRRRLAPSSERRSTAQDPYFKQTDIDSQGYAMGIIVNDDAENKYEIGLSDIKRLAELAGASDVPRVAGVIQNVINALDELNNLKEGAPALWNEHLVTLDHEA